MSKKFYTIIVATVLASLCGLAVSAETAKTVAASRPVSSVGKTNYRKEAYATYNAAIKAAEMAYRNAIKLAKKRLADAKTAARRNLQKDLAAGRVDLNRQTIHGKAYLSPNAGEGMSIQYTQTSNGQVYHPFIPLQRIVDSGTKITNSNNQAISFTDIKVGDSLVVDISLGPCVLAVPGGKSGCQSKLYSIQDLSQPMSNKLQKGEVTVQGAFTTTTSSGVPDAGATLHVKTNAYGEVNVGLPGFINCQTKDIFVPTQVGESIEVHGYYDNGEINICSSSSYYIKKL